MNSSDVRRLFFLRHHFRRKSEEDSCWERIAAIEIWSCLRSKSAVGCGRDDGIYVSRIFVSSPVGTVSRLRRSYAFLACLIRVTSSDIASEICALIRLPKHCGESEARNREWSTSDAVCEFVHVHAFLFCLQSLVSARRRVSERRRPFLKLSTLTGKMRASALAEFICWISEIPNIR